MTSANDGALSPPAVIKQEQITTPQPPSPSAHSISGAETVKAVASLKNEHGLRTQSPLRESSVPISSTETTTVEQSNLKKRPAPARSKKGRATTKKMPVSKKRKITAKKEGTPLSKTGKGSNFKGTLATNSPPSELALSPDGMQGEGDNDDGDDDDDDEDEDMEDDGDADGDVYCVCRKPDNGTFMIGCDGMCDDWFHGKCVGIPECNKNLIDKYICPNCTEKGVGRTTWKRVCRCMDCNKPASTLRTKLGTDGSKYCTDECGHSYFRSHIYRMIGQDNGISKNRATSRRKTIPTSVVVVRKDLGARGGALAASELKALLDACPSIEEFRALGGNPTIGPAAGPESDGLASVSSQFPPGVAEALQNISQEKDQARGRHALLKDRIKFVSIAKTTALRVAAEKELKAKDFCGYDRRLEWSNHAFSEWRDHNGGEMALETETLPVDPSEQDSEHGDSEAVICDRKRCLRHNEWQKLAIDSLRHEISENSDHMRALESDEAALRERVVLAKLSRGEGDVEVHLFPSEHIQDGIPGSRRVTGLDRMHVDEQLVDGQMAEEKANAIENVAVSVA